MTIPQTFEALGLSPSALAAISRARFTQPTPIQCQAIPPALAGRDVIGCAATGTGKTAAFVLPIIEKLAGRRGTRALVLAPTRELALQIAEQVDLFGAESMVRSAVLIGGVGMDAQLRALRAGNEIVIATPGRLIDHLDRGTARLENVEVLVLDEADRMLDMGFKPQLERILKRVPKKRQTMLFSATMGAEITAFAKAHLASPTRVEVARSGTVAERATQRVFLIGQTEKAPLLLTLLGQDELTTLVFTRTKRRADSLARSIQNAGHKVARIHADRTQGQRRQALEGFKDGSYRVLVATDIASRGIDVEDIGHVVNFDLPHLPEDYVHRIGRTARAASSGLASSFCTPDDMPLLKDVERLIRAPITRAEVPRDAEVFKAESTRRSAAQRDPGPRHAGYGVSTRPPGQPVGRRARTHPKKPSRPGTAVSEVPAYRAEDGRGQDPARKPAAKPAGTSRGGRGGAPAGLVFRGRAKVRGR